MGKMKMGYNAGNAITVKKDFACPIATMPACRE
jgi:hypothetical protein